VNLYVRTPGSGSAAVGHIPYMYSNPVPQQQQHSAAGLLPLNPLACSVIERITPSLPLRLEYSRCSAVPCRLR
jgi:hypothetical protein